MALDGLVTYALLSEFQSLLSFNRIEKVYQPEADEIIILLRGQGKNLKLLLSVNSNYPRVHFTNVNKENPTTPPSFCMLLRKYLQGGKIVAITQPNFERIIKFKIETLDELNMVKSRELIIEMMGRHSNIILIDCESNKVLDSIKRISFDVSRYRQVLPGLQYAMPPSKDKYNPLEIKGFEEFQTALSHDLQLSVEKGLYSTFIGVSPLVAREICFATMIEGSGLLGQLSIDDFHCLYKGFSSIFQSLQSHDYRPYLFFDTDGQKYVDFSILEMTHLSLYQKQEVSSASEMLEVFYKNRDAHQRIKQKSYDLRKSITTKLDRLYNKVQNLHQDLKNAKKADDYRLKGDLLTAHLYQIQKGDEVVEVVNYYDEDQNILKIQLDKRLTPSQNAQSYYKKYNKAKNALLEVDKQLKKAKEEIDYLEQVVINIDQSTYLSDLEEIHSELIETGYLKKRLTKKSVATFKKTGYLKYISSDGLEILVGKNNKQNDEITLKIADKEDLWFHIKDMPGSHVLLKTAGKPCSETTVLEAATLAAYYSKAKNATKVAVDYTARKNVRKPKGAKPGMVIYDYYTTLLVDGTEQAISHLKQI
ncbi:putative RNA-binding protein [Clostridium aceticum]|uniref:Rqc2 homolog RqcH n=1 Tax=Clostridium aceticum TaxID=84022 RepID=A0A0D8I9B8_9CLOT|nr:NFACT RNA binding domain-containing protein [Clostridium aceticum]AKL95549.1 putative RNA-binding protein [Clostridium aceticum]KJF26870.1 fibronectin-binding protein [Clostridium aceticum]